MSYKTEDDEFEIEDSPCWIEALVAIGCVIGAIAIVLSRLL